MPSLRVKTSHISCSSLVVTDLADWYMCSGWASADPPPGWRRLPSTHYWKTPADRETEKSLVCVFNLGTIKNKYISIV